MEVNVQNLKQYFGDTRAVDDISFSFSGGNIFGFVGPNGAGKTTAMRILATLDEPMSGDAMVDGTSLVQYPEKARKLIGFMPDSLPIHRDITVHEYIDFFARAYGVDGRKRKRVVEGIEEFTNLLDIREKTLKALSKGMKQRVSLARAMVHDPAVLILDEPAAGLDPRARVELRELLKILAGRGKAILVSSHILTELAEICDGAIFIEQGRILRAGTMENILAIDTPHRTVGLRALEGPEELYKRLLEMPDVTNTRIVGLLVETDIDGGDEACGLLLSDLIANGVHIVEFVHQRAGLEDLFMTITKGNVQ
ncbi:MAG: ABC transporter ATP-binding protein [bacterium]|nr:ABC transporter ATP-binding protein [bacterium]